MDEVFVLRHAEGVARSGWHVVLQQLDIVLSKSNARLFASQANALLDFGEVVVAMAGWSPSCVLSRQEVKLLVHQSAQVRLRQGWEQFTLLLRACHAVVLLEYSLDKFELVLDAHIHVPDDQVAVEADSTEVRWDDRIQPGRCGQLLIQYFINVLFAHHRVDLVADVWVLMQSVEYKRCRQGLGSQACVQQCFNALRPGGILHHEYGSRILEKVR